MLLFHILKFLVFFNSFNIYVCLDLLYRVTSKIWNYKDDLDLQNYKDDLKLEIQRRTKT